MSLIFRSPRTPNRVDTSRQIREIVKFYPAILTFQICFEVIPSRPPWKSDPEHSWCLLIMSFPSFPPFFTRPIERGNFDWPPLAAKFPGFFRPKLSDEEFWAGSNHYFGWSIKTLTHSLFRCCWRRRRKLNSVWDVKYDMWNDFFRMLSRLLVLLWPSTEEEWGWRSHSLWWWLTNMGGIRFLRPHCGTSGTNFELMKHLDLISRLLIQAPDPTCSPLNQIKSNPDNEQLVQKYTKCIFFTHLVSVAKYWQICVRARDSERKPWTGWTFLAYLKATSNKLLVHQNVTTWKCSAH